jgi:hypothetical protein
LPGHPALLPGPPPASACVAGTAAANANTVNSSANIRRRFRSACLPYADVPQTGPLRLGWRLLCYARTFNAESRRGCRCPRILFHVKPLPTLEDRVAVSRLDRRLWRFTEGASVPNRRPGSALAWRPRPGHRGYDRPCLRGRAGREHDPAEGDVRRAGSLGRDSEQAVRRYETERESAIDARRAGG